MTEWDVYIEGIHLLTSKYQTQINITISARSQDILFPSQSLFYLKQYCWQYCFYLRSLLKRPNIMMKLLSSLSVIFLFLASFSIAAVTPAVDGTNNGTLSDDDSLSFFSKLFARAPAKDRPEPPLGESGYWVDSNKIVWIYYAEDKLADHAEHIRLHYEKYPSHDKAWGIASDKDKDQHGKDALDGVKEKTGYVRDEKMPKSFDYPVGSSEVTVMYCDKKESPGNPHDALINMMFVRIKELITTAVEGALLKNAKALAKSDKGKKLWRIKDNRKDKSKGNPIKAKGWGDDKKTTTKTKDHAKTKGSATKTSHAGAHATGTKRPAPAATHTAKKRKTKRAPLPTAQPTAVVNYAKRDAVPEYHDAPLAGRDAEAAAERDLNSHVERGSIPMEGRDLGSGSYIS